MPGSRRAYMRDPLVRDNKWELGLIRTPRSSPNVAKRETLSVKFCFFIDGIDEYDGDHLEFCMALKDLAESPNIKLSVSSRSWNAFEEPFGDNPLSKIYIHELTRGDITATFKVNFKATPVGLLSPKRNHNGVEDLQRKLQKELAVCFFGFFLS